MLDGEPTAQFKKSKYTKNDDDVEANSNISETLFYIHNIKLKNILEVRTEVAREKLLKVTHSVTSDGSDNTAFQLRVDYDCTKDFTGISDVYLTFVLDGNVCSSNVVGIRKKCGGQFAYSPLEISETSYWGLKKNILTSNGGQTNHPENLFDTANEAVVFKSSTNELNFRVKNVANEKGGDMKEIDMEPPIIKFGNEAEQVIYPVLRGAGARKHVLQPGEYTDFKLEFNCISSEEATESIELVFRPSYHTNFSFKMTKECEGITATDLIKKKYQDSLVFDVYAFLFIILVILAVLMCGAALYSKYKEMHGEEVNYNKAMESAWVSIKDFFSSAADKMKESRYTPDDKDIEIDELEASNITTDAEFDPHEVLKTKSKKSKQPSDEDEFREEVKVEFDRDDENYPSHELKDISRDQEKETNAYGTI